ncbi:velvet factor family protein [Aspergillus ibericus CBS 121593]|uniref:Velvet complex protein n=1 Tax=Aspergillus ibericus CBS 121593 TaxID=1448316 RepID=A0A395HAB4_9EURO|nr:velvet complex protein [Aspergillus ibericus CBS 121593]RAL04095.1 velvet complex protein [Aspergillus ibericus CBS 121593]
MPSGFERLLHHSPTPSPPPRRTSTTSRYHLFIRQQPIAARACGAGDRDRRPVDPPPIIQLLLTDFDPKGPDDIDVLQDPRFTVGCFLVPETRGSFSSDLDGDSALREDRLGTAPGQSTPLLSGKAFVSPFFVDEDPDPTTAPSHPSTFDYIPERRMQLAPPTNGGRHPAAFFIFSDLSVRTAGLYRLQFRLMNWGLVEDTGQSMPVLAEAWSDPFRVYPAKDFPGMRDSSRLTEGLKELGFVELKTRGKGKGKGRRR